MFVVLLATIVFFLVFFYFVLFFFGWGYFRASVGYVNAHALIWKRCL